MNIRNEIEKVFKRACEKRNVQFPDVISDESVLLEIGLDSLGFTVLVTDLEMKLGYDPFMLMDEPFFPRTFRELVDIYEKFMEVTT